MKTTRVLTTLVATVLLLLCSQRSNAQNIQVLYDTDRKCVTSTVEMFRPDNWGSTFFFFDVDYSPKAQGAYWEIARELCFWKKSRFSWLSLHVEYDGGLNNSVGSYNNSWLAGLTYSGHSQDFSKTWSVSAMYKLIPDTKDALGKSQIHNFQITGVWGIQFAKNWCTFSGFADFWREIRAWQGTEFIFIAEPQLWVNLNNIKGWENVNLSIGGELELSNNFVEKGFRAIPALGAKWSF
ncbi:MAG: DUF5020 family protein [Bacteroidaceae bacterium]|nr:DUF5020 family protein [Bacteroidaceae bacterium]